MYTVVKAFTDLQDNNYLYNVGDEYPRKGFDVLPSRIKELATTANRRREVLIKEVEEDNPKPKKAAKKAEKE